MIMEDLQVLIDRYGNCHIENGRIIDQDNDDDADDHHPQSSKTFDPKLI